MLRLCTYCCDYLNRRHLDPVSSLVLCRINGLHIGSVTQLLIVPNEGKRLAAWTCMLGVKTHLCLIGNPIEAAAKGNERYREQHLPLSSVFARYLLNLCLLSISTVRAVYPIGLKTQPVGWSNKTGIADLLHLHSRRRS